MTLARVSAGLAPAAFALLAAVLAALGAVPTIEAGWAAVAVALAFLPTGWLAPAGWRRRAAELSLLAPAIALTLLADPTMRRMALPPLLAIAGWAAAAAALPRAGRRGGALISAGLALALRSAAGPGLAGHEPGEVVLAVVAPALAAWGLARAIGPSPGLSLLLGSLPLERSPLAAVVLLVAGLLLARIGRPLPVAGRALRGVAPVLPAAALVLATLSPWGGLPPHRALPDAGWPALAAAVAASAAATWLPPAAGGAAWLAATLAFGPLQPPPPDRPGVELTAVAPSADLPVAESGLYVVDLALANGASVPSGRPIAHAGEVTLRAGIDAAEWAHERADVLPTVAHPLPAWPVWRPTGLGADTLWGVSGRSTYRLPSGARPRITRDGTLPPEVVVSVATAGSGRPTPPRSWPLPVWILAAAALVAALQLLSGTLRRPVAAVPWIVLVSASLIARMPVEPLRLLAERHAVDIALVALMAAWLPAASVWLARRRTFLTAAALLVPIAVATPGLFPPGGDQQYHLIVLRSLADDRDLELDNNYDLERYPENRIYVTDHFLHSPALGLLLLPGYLVAGRVGALLLLALAGAAVVALVTRQARALGMTPSRAALLATLLLLSYPLATFSSQIWVEMPGALAAALCLALAAAEGRLRGVTPLVAAVAAVIKTRLGLVTFPLAAAALWPRRWGVAEVRRLVVPLAAAALFSLSVAAVVLENPLGYGRHLVHLVPRDVRQPLISVGGLAFDAAGGLAFSAPLLFALAVGAAALWRRGGAGARALLVGAVATVLALANLPEWYGGGAPPARYLVPLLPAFALSGAALFTGPGRRGRALLAALLPPTLLVWWAFATRPHLAFNPGDGGSWLADALALRFVTDTRHLFPSFLRPSAATVAVPVVLVAVSAVALLLARRRPAVGRALARIATALWLTAAAGLVLTLHLRTDRVVELEDPQVARLGGRPEPAAGTYSRFTYPNGWRVSDGEGVEVPLNLRARSRLRLEGWLEGPAAQGATVAAAWDGGAAVDVLVSGNVPGSVALPPPPGPGRHRLRLLLRAPAGGSVVLDRIVVVGP